MEGFSGADGVAPLRAGTTPPPPPRAAARRLFV